VCIGSQEIQVLHLLCQTDPQWVTHALAHLDEVLVDHAHCEMKAASTALAFAAKYPDDPLLVERLAALAAEEAEHFSRMVQICHQRGLKLDHPAADPYVARLLKLARKDWLLGRVDRLLVCAIVEARSCERLKLMAEHLQEPGLKATYEDLWRAEAGHHQLFLELAVRSLSRLADHTDQEAQGAASSRLEELCLAEAEILNQLPLRAAIH
jgi:tRNA-(ms[2]io[6]A)-hydroxylase